MERLRLFAAWMVTVLWGVQMTLDSVPGTNYDPSPYVHAIFGGVVVALFGKRIFDRNGDHKNGDHK